MAKITHLPLRPRGVALAQVTATNPLMFTATLLHSHKLLNVVGYSDLLPPMQAGHLVNVIYLHHHALIYGMPDYPALSVNITLEEEAIFVDIPHDMPLVLRNTSCSHRQFSFICGHSRLYFCDGHGVSTDFSPQAQPELDLVLAAAIFGWELASPARQIH